jgi:hypothetical protein
MLASPTAATYLCALNCLNISQKVTQHTMNLPWSKNTSNLFHPIEYLRAVNEVNIYKDVVKLWSKLIKREREGSASYPKVP